MHKIYIDGVEVTEEQAREIIINTPKNQFVKINGCTEFTSSVDGKTYVRYYEQVYQGTTGKKLA